MSRNVNRRVLTAGARAVVGQARGRAGARAHSSQIGRLARRESQYATTYVDRRRDGLLSMTFGINQCLFVESLYNPADPAELPVTYTQFMTLALAYTSQARRVFEIGLGGGRIASYLHDFLPAAHVTCAELDPGVVELAQRSFGVRPGQRLRLVEQDGRIYARRTRERYDIILVDAYQGTLVPFHLVTREFYAILKQRLEPGGVVAQNISPDVLNRNDMIATALAVFANAEIYRAGGNWVLVAYDGPRKTDQQLRARASQLQSAHDLRYPLGPMLDGRTIVAAPSGSRVYTDDFAPVGYHDRDRECRAGR
jgi:spermidine synthase